MVICFLWLNFYQDIPRSRYFLTLFLKMRVPLLFSFIAAGVAARADAAAVPFPSNPGKDISGLPIKKDAVFNSRENLQPFWWQRRKAHIQQSALTAFGILAAALAATYLVLQCFMALKNTPYKSSLARGLAEGGQNCSVSLNGLCRRRIGFNRCLC